MFRQEIQCSSRKFPIKVQRWFENVSPIMLNDNCCYCIVIAHGLTSYRRCRNQLLLAHRLDSLPKPVLSKPTKWIWYTCLQRFHWLTPQGGIDNDRVQAMTDEQSVCGTIAWLCRWYVRQHLGSAGRGCCSRKGHINAALKCTLPRRCGTHNIFHGLIGYCIMRAPNAWLSKWCSSFSVLLNSITLF